jgi:hypothetical protein
VPTYPKGSRPAGSLLYVPLFHAFGFAPEPFRICCCAPLAANLLLAFRFAFRLTGSRRVAAVSVLILAYHGNFWAMYVNTGLCYDLLCFFFYSAAFLYYLDVRRRRIAAAFDWFRARQIRFGPGGKALFLRDPFPDNGYSSAFLLRLYSRDSSLRVERLDRIVAEWPPERVENFAYVFTFDQDHLLQCDASPFAGVSARDLAAAAGRHPHCE